MKAVITAAALAICSVGCGATRSTAPESLNAPEVVARPELTVSIFKEDQAVISNEDVARLLDSKVAVAKASRLLIYRLGPLPWDAGAPFETRYFDCDLSRSFFAALKDASRLRDASILPPLLAPPSDTIPHLRAAAARSHAELVFAYRLATIVSADRKVFAKNEARVFSAIEGILIHVRTGLVIFSTISTEQVRATETKDDRSIEETSLRAQQEAFAKAFGRIGVDLRAFLDAEP